MPKFLLAVAAALAVAAIPATVDAAPCKDAKGKFIKCPPAAAKPATKATPAKAAAAKPAAGKKAPCRDAKGKFTKCK